MIYGYYRGIAGTDKELQNLFKGKGANYRTIYIDEKGNTKRYEALKEKLKKGDILYTKSFVTMVSSIKELIEEIKYFDTKGIELKVIDDKFDSEGIFNEVLIYCLDIAYKIEQDNKDVLVNDIKSDREEIEKNKETIEINEKEEKVEEKIEEQAEVKVEEDIDEEIEIDEKMEDIEDEDEYSDKSDEESEEELIKELEKTTDKELIDILTKQDIEDLEEKEIYEDTLKNTMLSNKYNTDEYDRRSMINEQETNIIETPSMVKKKMPAQSFNTSEIPKNWGKCIEKDNKLKASINDLMSIALGEKPENTVIKSVEDTVDKKKQGIISTKNEGQTKQSIKKQQIKDKVETEKKQSKDKSETVSKEKKSLLYFSEEERKLVDDILGKTKVEMTEIERKAIYDYVNTTKSVEIIYEKGSGISKRRLYKLITLLGIPRRGRVIK